MQLRFISDLGHGWLEAPMQLIEQLGIKNKISLYSYRKGNMVYLEEDCDASVLLQAARAANIAVTLFDVYEGPTSPIRNYSRFVV